MSRKTKEEMFPLIEEWESSNESRESFCEVHKLTKSTFHYWRGRFLRSRVQMDTGGFVQVRAVIPSQMEVVYPNGVTIRLLQSASMSDLRALVQLI